MRYLQNYFPKTFAIKVGVGFMPAKPGFSQTKVCGYQGRFRVILQEPPVKVVSHEGAKSFVLAKNLSGPNLRGFGWMLIADT